MPYWLFPDLVKKKAYANATRYWETVWADVQSAANVKHGWTVPWMQSSPDGNPMFTAVCRPLRRGVRIIHEQPPDAEEFDLDWWLDWFGDEKDPDAIHELVIACCPSDENAGKIRQLLKQWIKRGKLTLRRPTAAS
jgi:hypothetical protein